MHCYSYDWFGLVSNVRLLFVGSHFIRKTPLLLFRSTNSCPSATTDMPQGKSEERATPKYLHCPWMMAMLLLLILVLESEIMCLITLCSCVSTRWWCVGGRTRLGSTLLRLSAKVFGIRFLRRYTFRSAKVIMCDSEVDATEKRSSCWGWWEEVCL